MNLVRCQVEINQEHEHVTILDYKIISMILLVHTNMKIETLTKENDVLGLILISLVA